LSKLSAYASSPIREDDILASRLAKEGNKVIKLNSGDPARYINTPKRVIKAYIEALKRNENYYSNSQGIEPLRQAIAARHKKIYGLDAGPEKIVVTQGISEGIQFLNIALIDKGDKAILIRPYYPSYISYLQIVGGKAIFADAIEESNWNIDLDALAKRVKDEKRIKYILITNPNNPAGYIISRKKLEEIVEFANEHELFIISDEIYDELVYRGSFTSISQVAGDMPYMILNGMSKNFVATGFRLGYMLVPNEDEKSKALLGKLIELAQMRLSPNTPAQFAYAEGLRNLSAHNREVSKLRALLKERLYFATRRVNESDYMHALPPSGAFYVFPKLEMQSLKFKSDKEFVSALLLEKYIQVTRGSGFGMPGHFRIVALPSKEVLGEAIERINEFCKEHSVKR